MLTCGLRRSDWTYVTSATAGSGRGYFVASGGRIDLVDPKGNPQSLYFFGLGVGVSVPLRQNLIKLPRLKIRGEDASLLAMPAIMPSGGEIYRSSIVRGSDLAPTDFVGGTLFLEASCAALIGLNCACMLFGYDRQSFESYIRTVTTRESGHNATMIAGRSLTPTRKRQFEAEVCDGRGTGAEPLLTLLRQAKGIITMAGISVGTSSGMGGGLFAGYIQIVSAVSASETQAPHKLKKG